MLATQYRLAERGNGTRRPKGELTQCLGKAVLYAINELEAWDQRNLETAAEWFLNIHPPLPFDLSGLFSGLRRLQPTVELLLVGGDPCIVNTPHVGVAGGTGAQFAMRM